LIDASLMQLHVGVPTEQHLLKTVKLWCVKYAGRKLREQIRYYPHNLKFALCSVWTHTGEWRYSSTYSYLGTRQRWNAKFMSRPLYRRKKSQSCLLNGRLDATQNR